jgi:hypothetical protein
MAQVGVGMVCGGYDTPYGFSGPHGYSPGTSLAEAVFPFLLEQQEMIRNRNSFQVVLLSPHRRNKRRT